MGETNEHQNLVSRLPLLFANGYPTTLDKITEAQLEKFIPFMVRCSNGQIEEIHNYKKPEWWPKDVEFTMPLVKPKNFKGSWLSKMKEIVVNCYQFHISTFLLEFCIKLTQHEPASLRFINNYNSSISLYDRKHNKLLVTFRNENLSYDQPQKGRKFLLSKKRNQSDSNSNDIQQLMVEQAPFDIYLCDYCDGEFYSYEAIKEHEKTCTSDNEVIICDSSEPETSQFLKDRKQKPEFLLNFELQCCETLKSDQGRNKVEEKLEKCSEEIIEFKPIEKVKRLPRRNRGIYALSRCPTIPLSSPCGQLLIKTTKTLMSEEYLFERLDRIERFCHAPFLAQGVNRPKFMDKKFNPPHVQCTFKKPVDSITRTYIFPRRQYKSRNRDHDFLFINSALLKICKPFTIPLKRCSEQQLLRKYEKSRQTYLQSISTVNKLEGSSKDQDKNNAQKQRIIDVIDLCSSDDEEGKLVTMTTDPSSQSWISHTTDTTHDSVSNSSTKIPTNMCCNLEGSRNVNKFEGNFLVSSTIGSQTKPLQPSVFLFSNYSTEAAHFNHFPTPTNLVTTDELVNQENVENNLQTSSEDLRFDRNNSSKAIQHIYKNSNVPTNKINSPNRTSSIDLTM